MAVRTVKRLRILDVKQIVVKRKTRKTVNQDYCEECNQIGELLLCDSCTRSYHYVCLDQEVSDSHVGPWDCPSERAEQAIPRNERLNEDLNGVITNFIRKPFSTTDSKGVKITVSEKVAAKKKFLVVHFSHYYQIQSFHYPAEFALAEFSIFNGLGGGVSGLIDIGKIPLGYDYLVRERRKETCNPHPPFYENFHPYQDALGLMENIIRRHFTEDEEAILFTLKEFVPIVMNGMEWLFEQTGKFFNVRILPVSILVHRLVNETQEPEYQQGGEPSKTSYEVQHESQLERYLHDTYYAFSPELACEYHAKPENKRGVENCSENNVKRLIYNICKVLTPFYRVRQGKNVHYPIYRSPTPKPTTRNGLKIYKVLNIRRMAEIQRFASSNRMSDLLWSQSHSGLSSLEASSASERSSPSLQESSDSEVGSGSPSFPDESVDTGEMDPPDESSRLKSMFQVEPEFRNEASVNQFLTRADPAGEYSKDRLTYKQAMVDFTIAKQKTGNPVGRGRGRGMKVAEPQLFLSSFPPVKEDPRPGQFENATNVPRNWPVKISRSFDTQSVRSVSSSGSVGSLASTYCSRSDESLTTERDSRSSGMQLSKENPYLPRFSPAKEDTRPAELENATNVPRKRPVLLVAASSKPSAERASRCRKSVIQPPNIKVGKIGSGKSDTMVKTQNPTTQIKACHAGCVYKRQTCVKTSWVLQPPLIAKKLRPGRSGVDQASVHLYNMKLRRISELELTPKKSPAGRKPAGVIYVHGKAVYYCSSCSYMCIQDLNTRKSYWAHHARCLGKL